MKIMAIDYGDAHTGVAISDRTLTLCGFSTVVTRGLTMLRSVISTK